MKVSIYSMKIYENNGSVKASVSITFDDAIAINNIILKEDDSGKFNIFFPRKRGERFEVVHPVSFEIRDQIFRRVLAAYKNMLQEKDISIHGGNTHENNRSDQH